MDDNSEPIGLLIDYDFSVTTASEAVNHRDNDTPIGKRVAAASDAEVPSGTSEGGVTVGARRTQRQMPPTPVRFSYLLEMLTNRDL